MKNEETNYWVVGASWGGYDHQDERFVQEGFWMLGWEEGNQPDKASQMRTGDRIAIKRMKGKGQSGIRVMHIGVIRGVILDSNKVICTVDWCATGLDRDVAESKGCFKSIHGPYHMNTEGDWIREVFSL